MSFEIPKVAPLAERILQITGEKEFGEIALEVFYFQYGGNPLYQRYCDLIHCIPSKVTRWEEIPFLPISFFKTHVVKTTSFTHEAVFESSGTTGTVNARHYVRDTRLYDDSCMQTFKMFYGPLRDYCFLALLPSYLERSNSSLVHMVKRFMERGAHPLNGFYLHDHDRLAQTLSQLESDRQPTVLIGVTYALLDFAAAYPQSLAHTIIIETGGMKGRRREVVRDVLHQELMQAFGVPGIHSEYGMTELLSQGYARANGRFETPPWMRVVLREEDDLRTLVSAPEKIVSGGINVIDLANIFSCSFIATEDIGRMHPNGHFEVLGRLDHSDARGCSLLAM